MKGGEVLTSFYNSDIHFHEDAIRGLLGYDTSLHDVINQKTMT
jgi:hypothetical protein